MHIPVIDLFAGPGGLGEGFSKARTAEFRIAVSIEKDEMAFETLQLRAAHRALAEMEGTSRETWSIWDHLLADSPWNITFERLRSSNDERIVEACKAARNEAWHIELQPQTRGEVSTGIRRRLRYSSGNSTPPRNAVLIGGPPCQAYSVVGRSRNRGTDGYLAENDHRHFLYREYLAVINEFQPAVFIMENVKGILSSKVSDQRIFASITSDLKRPDLACGVASGLEYVLFSLPRPSTTLFDPEPSDYIIESERHGVPQARHRVIICGVRRDVIERAGPVGHLIPASPPSVADVVADLPHLRPQLSFRGEGASWLSSFDRIEFQSAVSELRRSKSDDHRLIAEVMERAKAGFASAADPGSGADRFLLSRALPKPKGLQRWYRDRPIRLLANHESRSHMPADLVRYLFVAAYGYATGMSPRLADFPKSLLPHHKNIDHANPADAIFKDRFRVQLASQFSTTVTSHIGKDGHAFIHPDPLQCRSLTVREAARLQTFPDSYVFLGNRTSQYSQVGNAVPPYLAKQIADIVGDVLARAGMA